MAKKGGDKRVKRHKAPKTMHLFKKEKKFTLSPEVGPHSKERSVPIGYILRDCLKVASSAAEAKKILNEGKVRINGKIRKSLRFPVGLFDFVSIEGLNNEYKILFDTKGRLYPEKVEKKNVECIRPSKIVRKTVEKKGIIKLTTDSGNNYLVEGKLAIEAKPNDTLLIKIPEDEIKELKKMEVGAKVYIIAGPHVSKQAIITSIKPGTAKSSRVVIIKQGQNEFETTAKNVVVIE
ncbi:MAG: S4 domain-containing protein [Candidatus Diapherotrites archaeon]|nr:S4 domain-containing protein [Candidatus Diapherotrites archaeon]